MVFDQIGCVKSFGAVQVQGMQARYSRSETPVGWCGETSMYSDCIPSAVGLSGSLPSFVQILGRQLGSLSEETRLEKEKRKKTTIVSS